jgi:hypothetical protein
VASSVQASRAQLLSLTASPRAGGSEEMMDVHADVSIANFTTGLPFSTGASHLDWLEPP